jgi:hypothetical protein
MSMNSTDFLQSWRVWSGCSVKYQDSFGDKAKNKSPLLQHMRQETKEFQKKNKRKPNVMLAVHDT